MPIASNRVSSLFETESYFLGTDLCEVLPVITRLRNKKIAQFVCNYVAHNKISDIRPCEEADYVNATFRTDPQATHVLRVGDLVPCGHQTDPGLE